MEIQKKSLKKNMMLNSIKQILSLLIPLITFPYVSQHLGVNAFGVYNLAASVLSYLSYLAAMGITTYAIREGSKIRDNRAELNKLCSELFSINILFTLISYIVLLAIVMLSRKLFLYKECIFILSISMIFTAIGTEWINEIFEDYGYLTLRYIVIQIISIILIFVFVHNESDLIKYCGITVLSTVFIGVLNVFHRRGYVNIELVIKCNINKHIKHMFVFFCSSIASVVYVNSDIIIIGFVLSTYEVGIYSFSVRIYSIIKIALSAIISTAIPRLTYYFSNDVSKYQEYLNRVYTSLVLVVLPISIGMICLRKDIIYILGHTEYLSGDTVLFVLAIAMVFALFGSFYYSLVLIIHGEEKVMLYGTIIAASLNIILNIILIPQYGIVAASITTLIAEICCFIVALAVSQKKYKMQGLLDKVPHIYSGLISIIIILAWFLISRLFNKLSFNQAMFRAVFLMCLSAVIYLILLISSHNSSIVSLKMSILGILRKK